MNLHTDMTTHTAKTIGQLVEAGFEVHNSADNTRFELQDADGNVLCTGVTLGDLAKEAEKAGLGL